MFLLPFLSACPPTCLGMPREPHKPGFLSFHPLFIFIYMFSSFILSFPPCTHSGHFPQSHVPCGCGTCHSPPFNFHSGPESMETAMYLCSLLKENGKKMSEGGENKGGKREEKLAEDQERRIFKNQRMGKNGLLNRRKQTLSIFPAQQTTLLSTW